MGHSKITLPCWWLDENLEVSAEADTQPEESFRTFINQGGWTGDGGKRPENDTRPKPSRD